MIQFDPKEGTAGDKPVRNISVQQTGFGPTAVRVSATVWPSHKDVPLAKGDVVVIEGPYTQNKTQKDDGTSVTYHNLSVTRLGKLGTATEGSKGTTSDPVEDPAADDDDIPF